MIIQVYEIQTPLEAQSMIELGVDHIGSVILSMEGWKNPDLKTVVDLVKTAGRKSSLIPLFADESVIARCIDYYQPQIVHFCEALSPTGGNARSVDLKIDIEPIHHRQSKIRERFPEVEIMRSIPVAANGNGHQLRSIELAGHFEHCSDWLLIDTFLMDQVDSSQPVQGYVGITGRTCDWSLAKQLVEAVDIPVILAGGIGPSNVYEAVLSVNPAGVDSCTNTNAMDDNGKHVRFKKDVEKVATMVAEVKRAEKSAHIKSKQDIYQEESNKCWKPAN